MLAVMVTRCVEKVRAEKKLASTSRLQDIPAAQDKLASHLPPETQHEVEVTNAEPVVRCFLVFDVQAYHWLPFVVEAIRRAW